MHFELESRDSFNPTFPVQRDFGSNAVAFAGIDANAGRERDHLTVRLSVQPLFFAVVDYFGREQGSRFAMSAIKKVFEDFGGAIHDPLVIVEAFVALSQVREVAIPEKDIEELSDGGMEHPQRHATHVHFEFEMPPRGESSPLIKRMKELAPSLRMMRELLESDYNKRRLRSLLKKIAFETKNRKISAKLQKGDEEGATERFISEHFALPE